MKLHHSLCLITIVWAGHVFAVEPTGPGTATQDSAAIVEAIHQVEPWIAEELHALQHTSDREEVQAIASRISQRTDSLAKRFRHVFPDDDDSWMMFSIYTGLAAAMDACNPGLAAVYRATAATAVVNGEAPYRPPLYRALTAISDRSSALAHAKRAERTHRLIEKLRADHVDLVTAL